MSVQENHSALQSLLRLRFETYQIKEESRANFRLVSQQPNYKESEWKKRQREMVENCLRNSRDGLVNPGNDNVMDVLTQNAVLIHDWLLHKLKKKENRAETIHNKLDLIIPFFKIVGEGYLRDILTENTQEQLTPPGMAETSLGNYFSILRDLYKYCFPEEKKVPLNLHRKSKSKLQTSPLVTDEDVEDLLLICIAQAYKREQNSNDALTELDHSIALLLILAYTNLRRDEVLELTLGNIKVTDRITICTTGKFGKQYKVESTNELSGVPAWAIHFLGSFLVKRQTEENRSAFAPLFKSAFFTDRKGNFEPKLDTVYQRIRRFLAKLAFDEGLHAFRRKFASAARARGVLLLRIINSLGQSTTTTAPKSYIQIYPLLQKQQLAEWAKSQKKLIIPGSIPLKVLARKMGISVEGVFKLVTRAKQAGLIDYAGGRDGQLTTREAIVVYHLRDKSSVGCSESQ